VSGGDCCTAVDGESVPGGDLSRRSNVQGATRSPQPLARARALVSQGLLL
jgi:hypothetical protein